MAWEHKFGHVPSISFIFTGSKMARIAWVYYADISPNIHVITAQWIEVCFFSAGSRDGFMPGTFFIT